jgi:hypothetical protein
MRVLALLLILSGCGTAVLSPAYPKSQAEKPRVVLATLESVPARTELPVLVGVTEEPQQLFAWDLTKSSLLWKLPVVARSAPRVAADIVVTQEAEGVVGRALADGRELFSIDDDVQLVGIDGAGDQVVITLLLDPETDPRGLLVAADHGGIRWQLEIGTPAGSPALVGDTVIVPWGTQRVSLLDASDGAERVRLLLKDSVAGHAFVDRGAAFIGQHGLFLVDRQLESGARSMAHHYSPLARPMPGQPGLFGDSYEPVYGPEHASHRVNLGWRVRRGDKGELGMEDSSLYLQFYRMLFALDAESDSVSWIYQGDADVVATAVQPGGVYALDAAGNLLFLNSMGHVLASNALGLKLTMGYIRPGAFVPAASGGDAAANAQASASHAARPLNEQLRDAAKLDDPRLASGRAFAVEHLSRFDTAEVTAELVGICADPGAPEPVTVMACRKLAERSQGKEHVLAALQTARGGLGTENPPPIGALASAARSMGIKAAAPLLVPFLEDPRTRSADLAPLAQALGELGGPAQAAPLERFLKLYHAEPQEPELARALEAAARGSAELRGKAALPGLRALAADPMAMAGLAAALAAVIDTIEHPPAAKPAEATPAAATATAPAAKAAEADPNRPRYLSMDMVEDVLQKATPRLRRCLQQPGGEPVLSARVSMVVDSDGQVEGVFVAPGSTQACVEPIVREHRFPATRTGRQQVVHVIHSRTMEAQQARAEREAKRAAKAEPAQPAAAPRSKLADSAPTAETAAPAPATAPAVAKPPPAPAAAKPPSATTPAAPVVPKP